MVRLSLLMCCFSAYLLVSFSRMNDAEKAAWSERFNAGVANLVADPVGSISHFLSKFWASGGWKWLLPAMLLRYMARDARASQAQRARGAAAEPAGPTKKAEPAAARSAGRGSAKKRK